MDAQAFWHVIGNYNKRTRVIEIILFLCVVLATGSSYTQRVKWAAEFSLGVTNYYRHWIFFVV